jgi:beta propeller repeat protein
MGMIGAMRSDRRPGTFARRSGSYLLLALALLVSLLLGVRPAEAMIPAKEFPVSTSNQDEWSAAISEKTVVWQDGRNGDADVYERNIGADGGEFPVVTGNGDQVEPDVDGDIVVWEDWRDGNADIYAKRLSNPAEPPFPVTTAAEDQRKPKIDGDTVVWEDNRGGDWDVYFYDLGARHGGQVITNTHDQRHPAISGDTVVWDDNRGGAPDVYGKDLGSDQDFRVTAAPNSQDTPDISGDTVVWRDGRTAGHYDIYGKNLSDPEEFPVVTDAGDQVSPAISGDIAVWTDGRNGDHEIYGKNLSTGRESRVSSGSGPQEAPAIDSGTVVWEAQRTGDTDYGSWDISGADVSASTTITLAADLQTTTYGGQPATLSGRLVSGPGVFFDEGGLPGRQVVLEQRPAGAGSFGPVPNGTLTTAADGTFSLPGVRPSENTEYRARFTGVPGDAVGPSASDIEQVGVKPLVSISTSVSKIRLGKSLYVWGTVLPVETGKVKVSIERNGRPVPPPQHVPLNNSSYRLAYKPTVVGTYEVTATFAGNEGYLANTSSTWRFKVTR